MQNEPGCETADKKDGIQQEVGLNLLSWSKD